MRSYREQYRFAGNADCLIHYGISGQKWGYRRFQNEDGSLTEEGRQRYLTEYAENYTNAGVAKALFDQYSNPRAVGSREIAEHNKRQAQNSARAMTYNKQMYDFINKNKNAKLSDIQKASEMFGKKNRLDDIDGFMDSERKRLSERRDEENEERGKEAEVKTSRSAPKAQKAEKAKTASTAGNKKPAEKKMTQREALDRAYDALEKKYPNFDKMPTAKQDDLLFDYLHESGLEKYL